MAPRESISKGVAGARTHRSLGHHLLHPQTLRLLVLSKPADFDAQSSLLQNRLHPQIQIPNACPGPPDFSRSVNSISTWGTGYGHLITTVNPGFSDLPTALLCTASTYLKVTSSRKLRYITKAYRNFYPTGQIPKKHVSKLSATFDPNWHEGRYFYLPILFGSDFVSSIFIKIFPNFWELKIDSNWVNLTPCQAH